MSRMWHWLALQLVTAQVQWPLAIMCSMRYSCLLPVTVWVTVVHCCHSMSGCCPLPVTVWLAFAHFLSQYEGHLRTSCHSMSGSCPLLVYSMRGICPLPVTVWVAVAHFLSQYEGHLPTSCHSMSDSCPLPVTVWGAFAHLLSQYEWHLPTCYYSTIYKASCVSWDIFYTYRIPKTSTDFHHVFQCIRAKGRCFPPFEGTVSIFVKYMYIV